MAIRVYKPTTNARRNASVNMHIEVTKKSPEKSLLRPLHKTGGRNCQGKLTVIQQGGGVVPLLRQHNQMYSYSGVSVLLDQLQQQLAQYLAQLRQIDALIASPACGADRAVTFGQ